MFKNEWFASVQENEQLAELFDFLSKFSNERIADMVNRALAEFLDDAAQANEAEAEDNKKLFQAVCPNMAIGFLI